MDGIGLLKVTPGTVVMIALAMVFAYLAIGKKTESTLLLPLAFGILMANLPGANLSAYDITYRFIADLTLADGTFLAQGTLLDAGRSLLLLADGSKIATSLTYNDVAAFVVTERFGLMYFLYGGIRYVIYPPLVFLCIGTMTDFGPLISSPKSVFIGLGGQLGIFVAFGISLLAGNWLAPLISGLDPFTVQEAASIGIIGGADGPTAVFTASRLAPDLLASVAIAAFSYMALVPFIQPPIMKLLTTSKERVIIMPEAKKVTHTQKIIFPIAVTVVTLLLIPSAGVLVGMLMLGNLIRESGVVERYVRSLSSHVLNVLTLLVGISIGSSARADIFLRPKTLIIIACGLLAFVFGTVGGILVAKLLCWITKGKVNPLIGNAGVSAMPMAARISQKLGQRYNPQNHLLMHAMGPLVSGTILSGLIAGLFLAFFG